MITNSPFFLLEFFKKSNAFETKPVFILLCIYLGENLFSESIWFKSEVFCCVYVTLKISFQRVSGSEVKFFVVHMLL